MESIRQTLLNAITILTSPRSTPLVQSTTLGTLEQLLAKLALAPAEQQQAAGKRTLLDAFLKEQDGFEYNLASVLLDWLARTVSRLEERGGGAGGGSGGGRAEDIELVRSNLARGLGLMQGLLLLHRKSQRLFARRSALESLLTLLTSSLPSNPSISSPLLPTSTPSPSPVILPPSPSPSQSNNQPNYQSSSSHLSLVTLDTLLCALVDRPLNLRTFEEVEGLKIIVKVLKDKTVAQPVRIKVIELLYYYLLPEPLSRPTSSSRCTPSPPNPPQTTSFPTILTQNNNNNKVVADFVPQTPVKPRRFRPSSSSRRRERRGGGLSSSEEEMETEEEEEENTPRPFNRTKDVFGDEGVEEVREGVTPTRRRREVVEERKTTTRTTEEKRRLLRKVMPNVDALEERFRAMGLEM